MSQSALIATHTARMGALTVLAPGRPLKRVARNIGAVVFVGLDLEKTPELWVCVAVRGRSPWPLKVLHRFVQDVRVTEKNGHRRFAAWADGLFACAISARVPRLPGRPWNGTRTMFWPAEQLLPMKGLLRTRRFQSSLLELGDHGAILPLKSTRLSLRAHRTEFISQLRL